MSLQANRFFGLCVLICLLWRQAPAQHIEYSRQNVFVENPDKVILAGSIAHTHHLLTFTNNSRPYIYIFGEDLELKKKVRAPFKYPEKSEVTLIALDTIYYLLIRTYYNPSFLLWKVDRDGNVLDLTQAFEKLVPLQMQNRGRFQLIPVKNTLFLMLQSPFRNNDQTMLLTLDAALNIVYTSKVNLDMNPGDIVLQHRLLHEKELVILKTGHGGSVLQFYRINLLTGDIVNFSYSSTYEYTNVNFSYDASDSSYTIYAVLRQPGAGLEGNRYVFVTKLDHSLAEITPFAILRNQFMQNAYRNFIMAGNRWITLSSGRSLIVRDRVPTFMDTITGVSFRQNQLSQAYRYFSEETKLPVRFSLVDPHFKLSKDTLFPNNKNSYTLLSDMSATFTSGNQEYLLLRQRFFKKTNGLLMCQADNRELIFTDVRVNDRNDYSLRDSKRLQDGILILYRHKREAGLVKISMN